MNVLKTIGGFLYATLVLPFEIIFVILLGSVFPGDRSEESVIHLSDEEAEEIEKQQIAMKLLERERRRNLEKAVKQELIDNGEIMPAIGRAHISRDIIDAVYTRDGGRCVYCGSMENLQIDHIIPHSRGGANTIENLQVLCQRCNIEKSNHIG